MEILLSFQLPSPAQPPTRNPSSRQEGWQFPSLAAFSPHPHRHPELIPAPPHSEPQTDAMVFLFLSWFPLVWTHLPHRPLGYSGLHCLLLFHVSNFCPVNLVVISRQQRPWVTILNPSQPLKHIRHLIDTAFNDHRWILDPSGRAHLCLQVYRRTLFYCASKLKVFVATHVVRWWFSIF